ncbi:hypothetical protein SAMN05216503_2220 [Polaribacter sp. KT25b]|uniref:hypothetical protein n=1 Tax=Polaribacter sp. KT25b TaxID=1855336 RepID=UPI00087AF2F9|nr:hypothetical protein [Polaribacter sp. KT25b]SDS17686.1 hypothetical protein SAMN05216503_2220 [Polaribacter sp. KT25b]
MNQLIFKQQIKNNIIEINISNYQELSLSYSFEELNKRILSYILESKADYIKLSFKNISNTDLSISKIIKIRESLAFLELTVISIEISFML